MHLQDPIGALMGLAVLCDEAVVTTEADLLQGVNDDLVGMIYFDKDNPFVCYQGKPRLVEAREGGPVAAKIVVQVPHFTIIGRRKTTVR
jgi:hypothetical protein